MNAACHVVACTAAEKRFPRAVRLEVAWLAMPRSFDLAVEFPASVEQVHSAFSDEDYWLARLAAFGGSNTLDSLIVDADGTVTVATTQDLRRHALPRMVAKLFPGDICARRRGGRSATAGSAGRSSSRRPGRWDPAVPTLC